MTITHKLTQHYAVTTPPRYLTTGNACESRFIVIIPFPLTAPIVAVLFLCHARREGAVSVAFVRPSVRPARIANNSRT